MKVEVTYCSNYNGCMVQVHEDGNTYTEFDPKYKEKIEAVQTAVIGEAYNDVIKGGRHEGEFNGNINKLERFAVKTVREQFGDVNMLTVTFEEDSSST